MYPIKSYTKAKDIHEAIELLSKNENAKIIAGGTDILIKAREFKQGYVDKDLVDIKDIKSLKGIYLDENENIIISSICTFDEIQNNQLIKTKLPALATAASLVGGPQIRNVATIGGNICNAATSADSASALFASDAILIIEGNKKRQVSIKDFYLNAGVVDLKHDEILTHIKILKQNYENYNSHYIKFAPRLAMDIATLGCCVFLKAKDKIISIKIAFGVAAATPVRATLAEEFAKDKILNEENINQICTLCLKNTNARNSWRASKSFREHLIKELPKKAINIILGLKNE